MVAVAVLAACAPRPKPLPVERPSLDATATPSGTPDPREKLLEEAKTEPDLAKRAEKLAAIAKGAPPSDRLARSARVALVRTLAQAGKLDAMHKAAGDLEIADDSEGADLLNVMSYAYAEAGRDLDRALQYSQRALEVVLSLRKPDAMANDVWKRQIAAVIAAYRDTLGWVLFKGGDVRGAVRELSQAAEILPDDPTVNWHFGQALMKAGKHADAVTALVRSAVSEGDESPAAKALAIDAASRATPAITDLDARISAARTALEERVKVAALARMVTEPPRELTVSDAAGAPVRIQPGDGKPVLLLFWGSFSAPSVKTLKLVHASGGARVLSVSLDKDPALAKAAAAAAGFTSAVGLDPTGAEAEAFQVRGLPTLLVLDAQGRVRYRNEGIVPGYEIQLKAQLASLGDEK